MTISELVDFIDVNRDSNDEYIEIAEDNGTSARIKTSSDVVNAIGDWKVGEIEAVDKGVIRVWIAEE